MSDDETLVRALIERWAKAVSACDIDGVLVTHRPGRYSLDADLLRR